MFTTDTLQVGLLWLHMNSVLQTQGCFVLSAIIKQRLSLSAATNTRPDLCCCLLLTNAVGWMLSCERNPIIFYNMDISWPLVLEGQRSLVLQYPIIPSPTPSPTPTCGPIIYRQHTFLMQSDSWQACQVWQLFTPIVYPSERLTVQTLRLSLIRMMMKGSEKQCLY